MDAEERRVMKIRALGGSRDSYLGQLSEIERRRFQAAWRRLTRKMPEIRQALRKRAAEKRPVAEFEQVDDC